MAIEFVATGYGAPDVLKAAPTEPRQPKRGGVTIMVRAAGVNPRDYKSYSDRSFASGQGQNEPEFPLRLGVEASGIVTLRR